MLKMAWLNENGNVVCEGCGSKFQVPEGETFDFSAKHLCEECAAKNASASAEAELKSAASDEANKVIETAVR